MFGENSIAESSECPHFGAIIRAVNTGCNIAAVFLFACCSGGRSSRRRIFIVLIIFFYVFNNKINMLSVITAFFI